MSPSRTEQYPPADGDQTMVASSVPSLPRLGHWDLYYFIFYRKGNPSFQKLQLFPMKSSENALQHRSDQSNMIHADQKISLSCIALGVASFLICPYTHSNKITSAWIRVPWGLDFIIKFDGWMLSTFTLDPDTAHSEDIIT